MPETLAQVIADEREDAAVLRRKGHARDADLIERIIARVTDAAEDYITMIPESAAHMRSGKSVTWLRGHFAAWLADGHAELRGRTRYYRQVVIPQRTHPSVAAEQGRIAGEQARRSA